MVRPGSLEGVQMSLLNFRKPVETAPVTPEVAAFLEGYASASGKVGSSST